jgi:hypothetical protein
VRVRGEGNASGRDAAGGERERERGAEWGRRLSVLRKGAMFRKAIKRDAGDPDRACAAGTVEGGAGGEREGRGSSAGGEGCRGRGRMAFEALGIAQASKRKGASRAARGMALKSAQAGRGVKPRRNSSEIAAPGELVVRDLLQRTEWKPKTQQVLEKNVRAKKLAALYVLHERMRILTGRIEILEDELDLLGWRRRAPPSTYKTPYREELVIELCALPLKERAQKIRDLAEQEGIDRKSVYRKLQKCVRWSLRGREDPVLASKSNAVLNKRAALSDVG